MKLKLLYLAYILILFLILKLLAGCGDNITSGSNIVFPDSLVSYISHVEPFMRVKCSYIGCHCDPPNNGYNASTMSNYFSLFNIDNLGLVLPGNPDGSKLIQILERRLPHNYYLFPQGYFTQNQINGMRKSGRNYRHDNL
ncbi:MAG: hypothetical protein HZB41_12270 [Ignavibacteriae bacterium]|nr:hypothetical protein [Ignavibacteriota bacterium]